MSSLSIATVRKVETEKSLVFLFNKKKIGLAVLNKSVDIFHAILW